MGKKEVFIVILILAFVFLLDFLKYTGQPVRDSQYYFITGREREPEPVDTRYSELRERAAEVASWEKERYPLMINYTLVRIYITDLFGIGRHPRPSPYQRLKTWERDDLKVGTPCTRWDGRKGKWTVDVHDIWICN